MKFGRIVATSIALMTVAATLSGATSASDQPHASVTLPDMQLLVPTGDISIGTNPSTSHRQLQFTHVTWDAGTGPFAIQPTYNASTGLSSFSQVLYRSTAPGTWAVDSRVPLAVAGIFQAPSDYRYPLTRFTLNAVGAGGAIGSIVRISPKVDYCITGDAFVGGVPNAPGATSPPQSNCTSPSKLLGFSVGWGDQYDQTDNGQPIDLTGVPDGTYILRATVDPQHLFEESNRTNDVVDTKLQIAGTSVTVLAQTRPHLVPPLVTVTSPSSGATLKGTVTLQAGASATAPATVAYVQYLIDGVPLGPHLTYAPYRFNWATGPLPGTHTVSAQVLDSSGTMDTAPIKTVHVVRNHVAGLALDAIASVNAHGTARSSVLTTSVANDTLVAFASLDGPAGGGQSTKVGGLGLTWHLVRRSNIQAGDAEIWTAHETHVVRSARVTATPRFGGYAQQLVVLAMSGASGVGTSASGSAPSGAQSVTVKTIGAGSDVFSVGSDWDQAIARTVNSGQTMLRQWVDGGDGDTMWVQGTSSPVPAAGTKVVLGDSAPTTDRWDMAAVEVRAAPLPKASVVIANPAPGEIVSSRTPFTVEIHDAVAVRTARFLVDGRVIGRVRAGRLLSAVHWDTRQVANGRHVVTAVVRDEAGRTYLARVAVDVANPPPAMTCFVLAARMTVRGGASVTTPLVHIAASGERLLALVRTPSRAASGIVASGAHASWRLVRVERSALGTVAVWTTTTAPGVRTLRVHSVGPTMQVLTVLGFEGTRGLGATMSASGTSSRSLWMTTTRPTSLVLAVEISRSGLRTPSGWSTLSRYTARHWSTWVQYTNQPVSRANTRLPIPRAGHARGAWSVVVLELPGDGS